MTITECYASFGGNYSEVLGRLMKDERILKYLRKFAEGDDYAGLLSSLDGENWEEAFRHVHNLKGMALNLALTPLAKASDILCEALRGGKPTVDISGMLDDVKETYALVCDAIALLD